MPAGRSSPAHLLLVPAELTHDGLADVGGHGEPQGLGHGLEALVLLVRQLDPRVPDDLLRGCWHLPLPRLLLGHVRPPDPETTTTVILPAGDGPYQHPTRILVGPQATRP